MDVAKVIEKAGGVAELAELCGVEPVTVRGWKMLNEIPRRHALTLIRALRLRPDDLDDVMPEAAV